MRVAHADSATFWLARRTAVLITLLITFGAAGVYAWLGTPQAINPVQAQKVDNARILEMVEGLAARLKANPDNPKGWAMLARSYKAMGRLDEASEAYGKAGPALEADPDLLIDYADLLAVRAGDSLEGRPMELVNKALTLNPQHPMGLMMAGVAAYRHGDFAVAVARWEKLLALLEPGSVDAQQIEADIADARAKGGMPAAPKSAAAAMTPERINQMVDRLAERLKTTPDDLDGWARLGRAYKVQKRLPEAAQAYANAGKLVDGNPDLLTQYADVLAMQSGNKLAGRPMALVNKALALDPNHPTALMMAGAAAFQRADYANAVVHWEKVLTVLEPGSSDAVQVAAEIANARAKSAGGVKN